MAITRWSPSRFLDFPRSPLSEFFRLPEMVRFPSEIEPMAWGGAGPAVDVWEDSSNVYIAADLPGLDPKDVDIRLEGDVLVLAGERKREYEERHEGYHTYERSYGCFSRSFTLPTSVDRDRISARYEKGVLNLTLPKRAEVKAKHITIDAH